MLELQIQLPEVDMLMDLLQQVESCQVRCNEMLNGPINLKVSFRKCFNFFHFFFLPILKPELEGAKIFELSNIAGC